MRLIKLKLYKVVRFTIVYFIVGLVLLQVLLNLFSVLFPGQYGGMSFYLNLFLGINMFTAGFFVLFTFYFKFCAISRWAAIAEFLFCLVYLFIKEDNAYNIWFQIIAGTVALIATLIDYSKRFPLCRIGLTTNFLKHFFTTCSCSKAIERWEKRTTTLINKKYHQ
jgi:hypothetical protein